MLSCAGWGVVSCNDRAWSHLRCVVQLWKSIVYIFNSLNAKCVHVRTWHTSVSTFVHDIDIACKNVLISHNSMVLPALVTLQVHAQRLANEPHYSDEPLHFTNASLQYSKNKNARSPDQCSISYLFPSTKG